MRLLLDQDVYESTARFLAEKGHDVVRVRELGMATASDEDNLRKAIELDRDFLTRDRDYGNLEFVKKICAGVIYLRILPSDQNTVHIELSRVLDSYESAELKSLFVVVESGRHLLRRIKGGESS